MSFKPIDSKMDLPKTEEEVLDFWDKDETFRKTLEMRKDAPLYSFYDGPPFATGTPHYGHIVASTMKDAVPRYWTMRGYNVPRKWGWDCHGLPIENIAEKELGFKHKKDIEEYGIDKFNEICRSKVLGYVDEWEKVIRRLGRWADMKNSYKTMDLSYMESVWWVFKQLWDKGLVYESYRSMHICPRCETTLSQSEVAEGYRMVKDLSAIAKFELIDEPGTFILAWTTTPWTLIGNVALAVGKEIDYVQIKLKSQDSEVPESYIVAKELLPQVFKDQEYEVVDQFKGSELVGKDYKPLFDYYSNDKSLENRSNGWKVYDADFVTIEDGTGVVHIAPAFGEDDMNLGKEKELPFVQHVGMDGIIKEEAAEFAGMQVKPLEDHTQTDVEIIKYLAHAGLLFAKERYEHSYPHCWRCDTPLINYATSSWFVSVTKIKGDALKYAEEINWSPKHIKSGRFGKWLEGARDWSISRQRYWASVLPIWKCDKCGEVRVFGSVTELEQASGEKVTDLHKHHVDKIKFSCQKCDGKMTRIPDVIDTWFDSGSMPYAQMHYPFENRGIFEKSFPAQFIAEGVDQTRAWFYYLHIIASAVMQKPSYKNVIVNGTVLADDGKKMSKRLQNYPDPMKMFEKYGADSMRFYVLSSPVVYAENLNFSEADMAEISRGMMRMLWNSYSFFVLYANIDEWKPAEEPEARAENAESVLDSWILSELNSLAKNVNVAMENYELMRAARFFPGFIDNMSNWYIRRSRKRFWKSENDGDKESAYSTLYYVLITLAKLMAPFTPFISEEIYRNLMGGESVHLTAYPQARVDKIDNNLIEEMANARAIVEAGLSARAKANLKVRQPLNSLSYVGTKLRPELEEIVAEEVNVKKVEYFDGDREEVAVLDTNITEELKEEGIAREIIRNIQSLRKKTDFAVENRIELFYTSESDFLKKTMDNFAILIAKEVLADRIAFEAGEVEGSEEFSIEGEKIWIGIRRVK